MGPINEDIFKKKPRLISAYSLRVLSRVQIGVFPSLHDAKYNYNNSGPSELSLSPSLPLDRARSSDRSLYASIIGFRFRYLAPMRLSRSSVPSSRGTFISLRPNNFFLSGPNDNGNDVVSAHGSCLSCCNSNRMACHCPSNLQAGDTSCQRQLYSTNVYAEQ